MSRGDVSLKANADEANTAAASIVERIGGESYRRMKGDKGCKRWTS